MDKQPQKNNNSAWTAWPLQCETLKTTFLDTALHPKRHETLQFYINKITSIVSALW